MVYHILRVFLPVIGWQHYPELCGKWQRKHVYGWRALRGPETKVSCGIGWIDVLSLQAVRWTIPVYHTAVSLNWLSPTPLSLRSRQKAQGLYTQKVIIPPAFSCCQRKKMSRAVKVALLRQDQPCLWLLMRWSTRGNFQMWQAQSDALPISGEYNIEAELTGNCCCNLGGFLSIFLIILFLLLQVLVEFDDCEWKRREWIRIYDIFQVFIVEYTLVWAPRSNPEDEKSRHRVLWPGLVSAFCIDPS